jgi:hypothetical protein
MKVLRWLTTVMLVLSIVSIPALAQSSADGSAWRTLAEKFEGGVTVDLRLRDGQHFKATFIAADSEAMLVQRKTRIPVSVQRIGYDSIASLSRVHPATLSAGRIAAIALGSAGAAVGVLWLIALATLD